MDYHWRYQDDDGHDMPGPDVSFVEQAEAETWLAEQWSALLAGGVTQVTLLHGEAEVYGPMSLRPAS